MNKQAIQALETALQHQNDAITEMENLADLGFPVSDETYERMIDTARDLADQIKWAKAPKAMDANLSELAAANID